jgi:hypothetical protein
MPRPAGCLRPPRALRHSPVGACCVSDRHCVVGRRRPDEAAPLHPAHLRRARAAVAQSGQKTSGALGIFKPTRVLRIRSSTEGTISIVAFMAGLPGRPGAGQRNFGNVEMEVANRIGLELPSHEAELGLLAGSAPSSHRVVPLSLKPAQRGQGFVPLSGGTGAG